MGSVPLKKRVLDIYLNARQIADFLGGDGDKIFRNFAHSFVLTLIITGFLVYLYHGGDGIKTKRFLGCYGLIFHPNQPNMVSNESWNVYPPIEYLKTILCFVVFPYHGPEVA